MNTIGFAMCGSFCTFHKVMPVIEKLSEKYDVVPIMSQVSYETDTRFGKAEDWRRRIESACQKPIIHSVYEAEPIGPKKLLDALIIAPCTGNTIGKLAAGVYDTPVTLAAKAHLRNQRPVLIAVSTNDALSYSAAGIGRLMGYKNVYFVPMCQDDPLHKPASVVARFETIPAALEEALKGQQLQPVLC